MISRLFYILLQRFHVFRNRNRAPQGKIYMFHEIADKDDTYAIAPADFKAFLEYLLKHKKIVDADTLLQEEDPDAVVITFDDVYASVYHEAYPLLKEHGVPYYLFVCNEYLGKDSYLDEDMLKGMLADSKAVLGSHRLVHELSRPMAIGELEEDLLRSRKQLEELAGRKIRDLAFPYGSMYACSKEDVKLAQRHFDHVFMTYPLPYNKAYGNIIPRININSRTFRKEMT